MSLAARWALIILVALASAAGASAQGYYGGWYGYPPRPVFTPPPCFPGIGREEAINFDFACTPPSAALRIRLERSCRDNLKVLYQRCLFVIKYDTNALAKGTAIWIKGELDRMGIKQLLT